MQILDVPNTSILSVDVCCQCTNVVRPDLVIQFYAGFDTPFQSSVVSPEDTPKLALRTVELAGIRMVFDWRYYLQQRLSARGDTGVDHSILFP